MDTIRCPQCGKHNRSDASFCADCGSQLTSASLASPKRLETGQVLMGRYRIEKVLGQGGFGAVYLAWDSNLNHFCAIKENFETSEEAQRQFNREALILAKLAHANLPRVTDHFSIPDQGQYLVMDYIDGEDLESLIQRQGLVSPERAVAWVSQIADALIYLHSQDPPVIHRDIKPANIRLSPDGRAVLVDFGIVKLYDPTTKTTQGARAITPGYSPPEQYGQGKTDARSDIYALGATLYTLLTGEKPPESVERIAYDNLVPPEKTNRQVSTVLSDSVHQAMSLKPTERYQSANDFKSALLPQAPTEPTSTIRRSLPGVLPPTGWVLALMVVGLVAGGLFLLPQLRNLFSGTVSPSPTPVVKLVPSEVPATQVIVTEPPPPTVPPSQAPSNTPTRVPPTIEPTTLPPGSSVYVVQAGDTCLSIALTFSVTIESLVALNDLPSNCGELWVGQTLLIPQPAATVPPATSTPVPSTPQGTTSLAFASDRSGNFQIYLMNPETRESIALPNPTGFERAWWPSFCSDLVAAEVQDLDGGNPQWIYLLDPEQGGSQQWNPAGAPNAMGVPRCSPNGKWLAHSAQEGGMWVMNIDDYFGNQSYRVDDAHLSGYASWPMVGNVLYSMANIDRTFVIRRTADFLSAGSQVPETITNGKYPALSPDGGTMAYFCKDALNLCLFDTATNQSRELLSIAYLRVDNIALPASAMWSGDGNWIYYASASDGDWDIYRIRPDGGNLQNLTGDWGSSQEIMPALRW